MTSQNHNIRYGQKVRFQFCGSVETGVVTSSGQEPWLGEGDANVSFRDSVSDEVTRTIVRADEVVEVIR